MEEMENLVCVIPNSPIDGNTSEKSDEVDIEEGELSSDIDSHIGDTPHPVSLDGKALKNLHVEVEIPVAANEDQPSTERNLGTHGNEEDMGIMDLKVHNLEVIDGGEGDDREVNVYLGEGLTVADRVYKNKNCTFVMGIDVTTEEARLKRLERAKRFGIEIIEEDSYQDNVKKLYESLGMYGGNGVIDESVYRLDTIHLRGTDEMSTDDVFWYYRDFPPEQLEWINDTLCNVVWAESSGAIRAISALSSPIVLDEGKKGDDDDDTPMEVKDTNQIENSADGQEGTMTIEDDNQLYTISPEPQVASKDLVSLAHQQEDNGDQQSTGIDLKTLPKGKWRIGVAHPKSNLLIMRFATYSDRKELGAEEKSKYYMKYGNPNYGGVSGIITESRRNRMRERKFKQDLEIIAQQQTKAPTKSKIDTFVMPKRPRIGFSPDPDYNEICSNSDNEAITANEEPVEDPDSSESGNDESKWKGLTRGMRADEEERKGRKRSWTDRVHVPIWKRISFDTTHHRPTRRDEHRMDARNILNARRQRWNVVECAEPDDETNLYSMRYNFSSGRNDDDDDAQSSRAEKDSGSEVEDGELKDSPSHSSINKHSHIWENVIHEQKRQDATVAVLEDPTPPRGRELVSYGDMVDLVNFDSEPESNDLRHQLINRVTVQTIRRRSVDSESSESDQS